MKHHLRVEKVQLLPEDLVIEEPDENDSQSVQAAWDAEIIRRMEDLDSGKVKPISLKEFRRRLSSSLDYP
jgi:putative addiction module component (TIGR02574 family)